MSQKAKDDKETALRDWTNDKVSLANKWIDNTQKLRKRKIVQRGVYWCTLGENLGSEQNTEKSEMRPVLVMSNNIINPGDPNVLIAPLSKNLETKIRREKEVPKFGSHYFLRKNKYTFLDYDSAVMTEAMRSVSKVRIGSRMGEIDTEDYKRVQAKLKWTTGL
jgi:mRNA interferase MazF